MLNVQTIFWTVDIHDTHPSYTPNEPVIKIRAKRYTSDSRGCLPPHANDPDSHTQRPMFVLLILWYDRPGKVPFARTHFASGNVPPMHEAPVAPFFSIVPKKLACLSCSMQH